MFPNHLLFIFGFRYFYFVSINTWLKWLKGGAIICPAPVVRSSARDRYGAPRRSLGLLWSLFRRRPQEVHPCIPPLHCYMWTRRHSRLVNSDILQGQFILSAHTTQAAPVAGGKMSPIPTLFPGVVTVQQQLCEVGLWVWIRCCCLDTRIAPEWDRAGHPFSALLLLGSREFWVH